MDNLTFVERLVSHIAWPVVALVILFILRRKLRDSVDRIVKVLLPGGAGVEFSASIQEIDTAKESGLKKPGEVPYYLRGDENLEPIIQEMEQKIRNDMQTIEPPARETALIRNLIAARLQHSAESIYNSIFSSQIKLLIKAEQAGTAGISLDDVQESYQELLNKTKSTDQDYSLKAFLDFLLIQKLLEKTENDRYRLTALGRAFLQYIRAWSKPFNKIP